MILSPLCSNRSTSSECHSIWWWYARIDFNPTTAKTRLHDIWSLPQPLQCAQSKLWNLIHYSFFKNYSLFQSLDYSSRLLADLNLRFFDSPLWFCVCHIIGMSQYEPKSWNDEFHIWQKLSLWVPGQNQLFEWLSRPCSCQWNECHYILW